MTYGELDRRSNRLANYLVRRAERPNEIIGVVADRSLATFISILSILKAGGSYLPLDPTDPIERLKYLLEDTGCSRVLGANVNFESDRCHAAADCYAAAIQHGISDTFQITRGGMNVLAAGLGQDLQFAADIDACPVVAKCVEGNRIVRG